VNSCTFYVGDAADGKSSDWSDCDSGDTHAECNDPDAQSGSLANAFSVTGVFFPAPLLTAVNPNTGAQGQALPM